MQLKRARIKSNQIKCGGSVENTVGEEVCKRAAGKRGAKSEETFKSDKFAVCVSAAAAASCRRAFDKLLIRHVALISCCHSAWAGEGERLERGREELATAATACSRCSRRLCDIDLTWQGFTATLLATLHATRWVQHAARLFTDSAFAATSHSYSSASSY